MIGIIGSGNVGANTAFFLAEKGVDHVLLYDVQEGFAKGKALDMMEASPIRGYRTTIQGSDEVEPVLNCDIIIITAGAVRQPGEKRDDLLKRNQTIICEYAQKITRPDAKVILVTEPVDPLTTLFARESALPSRQIMGLGGVLDATRLRYLIARHLKVSMENVAAQAIGRHTNEMILLKEYCCVSGISIDNFMDPQMVQNLFDQTREAGHLIVELAGRASAYYGPSAVAVEIADAVRRDTGRLLSVSQMLTGQYGINDIALSLPAFIGKNGIARVVEPHLTQAEIQQFQSSADGITQALKEAGNE